MTTPEVSIVLPAYNEAANILETIKKIKNLYPDYEVLVVNDGSKDQTMQLAMEAGANVWPHPYNMGNGAAVKTGLRCATGKYVILMDADGQHDPMDIQRLLEHKNSYDMVIGARKGLLSGALHRNVANRIYNLLASYVTGVKIEDLTSGFRLVNRDVARQFIYLLPNGFSYPTTITMAYLRSGRSVKYVPIKAHKRGGKSKIKLLKDGSKFFLIIARVALLFSPLRVFLPTSLFFFFTGLFYYIYTYIVEGRFTNMSALLLTTSIVIFMMGLLSEQVSQMRYDRIT